MPARFGLGPVAIGSAPLSLDGARRGLADVETLGLVGFLRLRVSSSSDRDERTCFAAGGIAKVFRGCAASSDCDDAAELGTATEKRWIFGALSPAHDRVDKALAPLPGRVLLAWVFGTATKVALDGDGGGNAAFT